MTDGNRAPTPHAANTRVATPSGGPRGAARKVLLLCGGRSSEHAVSLASARSVLEATRGTLDVTPLVISSDGTALGPRASMAALEYRGSLPGPALGEPSGGTSLRAEPSNDHLVDGLREQVAAGFDVVFPLFHGPFGEDGSMQGLLKVLGLPFIGSDVLGSAVGMDKLMMKSVFAAGGLPQVRYAGVTRHAWRSDAPSELARLEALTAPWFVKPANLGSSIGIRRVDDRNELASAIDAALAYDRRVIVEEGVVGARELEVAVLGNDELRLSPVGEVGYARGFYDYEAKYTGGLAELHIPATLPEGLAARVHELAARAFHAVDAAGLARVDFFYQASSDRLLLNEINTMPGFTRFSMYPKLWEAGGLPYPELVSELVELALERR